MWSIFVFVWYTSFCCWWWITCCRAGSTQGHCKANRKGNTLFFNQDFLNQEVRHNCLNNRCLHLQPWWWGWRSEAALSQEVCPAERWGKRTSDIARACSAGCGMLRGGQKEVGTYKQILKEGAHRRAFLFSCDILVIHLWSLGDGWSYLLPFRGWRSHECLGWIHILWQKKLGSGLELCCIVCAGYIKGCVLSQDWWCQAQYLTSPLTLVPKLVFILQKTAWACSSCATTKVMLVGGRKQMQGIYFPAHQGNASAFGLDLMFRSLADFLDACVTAVFSYEIITSFRMHFGCHHSFLSSKGGS